MSSSSSNCSSHSVSSIVFPSIVNVNQKVVHDVNAVKEKKDKNETFWGLTYPEICERYALLTKINWINEMINVQKKWDKNLFQIKKKLEYFEKCHHGWSTMYPTLVNKLQIYENIWLCKKEYKINKITHLTKEVLFSKSISPLDKDKTENKKSFLTIDLISNEGRTWFIFRWSKTEREVFENWEIYLDHLQQAVQSNPSDDGVLPHVFLIYMYGKEWKIQSPSIIPGITIYYGLPKTLSPLTSCSNHQGVVSLLNVQTILFENMKIQLDLNTFFMLTSHMLHSEIDHPGKECKIQTIHLFPPNDKLLLLQLVKTLEQLRDTKQAIFYVPSLTYKILEQTVFNEFNEKTRAQQWLPFIQIIDEKYSPSCQFSSQFHPKLSEKALSFVSTLLNKSSTKNMFENARFVDLTFTSHAKIVEKLKKIGYFTSCRIVIHPHCPLSEKKCHTLV